QRPEAATLHHALGLALIRQQRWPAAVEALGHAARLAPDNARHAYVLGLAQARAGEPETALATLRAAQRRHPEDRDLLVAIVDLAHRHGEQQLALDYATKLQRLGPP
ncbi:MAG: tetratricopeptide repeat protein, partial [Marichromatium sp.]|nr:tetratricopeptide repeat protein [Marichromatium sp.]